MDWDAVSAIAEVIGAIAIVVSLIYVGVQVNDGTRAARSATASDAASVMQAWYLEVGSDAQKSKLFLNGMANPDAFSREEFYQFTMMLHAGFLAFQNAYYLSQEGTLDGGLQRSITNVMLAVKDQPGFHLYWNDRKQMFNPSFVGFVDNLLESDERLPLATYPVPQQDE
jgi:hypothetical protein